MPQLEAVVFMWLSVVPKQVIKEEWVRAHCGERGGGERGGGGRGEGRGERGEGRGEGKRGKERGEGERTGEVRKRKGLEHR